MKTSVTSIATLIALLALVPLARAEEINFEAIERHLERAINREILTEEQAEAMLDALREEEHGDDDEHEDESHPLGDLADEAGTMADEIMQAAEEGDIGVDEAWEKWETFKNAEVAPAIKVLITDGEITEGEAKEFWVEIEFEEAHTKIEDALNRGEITAEEAEAKHDAISEKRDAMENYEDHVEDSAHDEIAERLKAAVQSGELSEEEALEKWEKANGEEAK